MCTIFDSPTESVQSSVFSVQPPALPRAVKITGGPLNGFTGTLVKACEQWGSVIIHFEGRACEEIVALRFCTPLRV